jgi:hypothetical protein
VGASARSNPPVIDLPNSRLRLSFILAGDLRPQV